MMLLLFKMTLMKMITDLALDEFVSELVAFSLEQVDSLTEKAVLVLKTLEEFVS